MVMIPQKEFEKKCLIKLPKYNNLERSQNINLIVNNLDKSNNLEENLEQDIKEENLKQDIKEENLEQDTEEENLEQDTKEENLEQDTKELKEIDLEINNDLNNEVISLRDPIEVYKEIYLAAKKKATELRKNALASFLEAKSIKQKYFENADDSEDEEEEFKDLCKF